MKNETTKWRVAECGGMWTATNGNGITVWADDKEKLLAWMNGRNPTPRATRNDEEQGGDRIGRGKRFRASKRRSREEAARRKSRRGR